jgi:integrase
MGSASEHKRAVENIQNRTETGQWPDSKTRRRLPKSHVDYWFSRLKKRSYTDGSGGVIEIPNWQARLQKGGREGWFNLGTANQAAAARKAKEIFTFLDANGWQAALAKFKPGLEAAARPNLTVGDYLSMVRATGQLRVRTFLNYQNCFRTIVSESFGIRGNDSKYDYRQGGNQNWAARIGGVRLERITPEKIMKWKRKRLARAGNSPVVVASAKRTINSYIRCARCLFSQSLTKRLKSVQLPATLPFAGVEMEDTGSMKYNSKINAQALIAAAKAELKPKSPEVYKVFLLGLFAGMRKGEIDLAEWRMIDWQNNLICLEETEWLHLKTKDSAGQITVDGEVIGELRQLKVASQSPFIVTSNRPPRNNSSRPYYRCAPVFESLTAWLRSKGVKANKPLHEMRKEIGALIATQHGIYAASQFLRHSDITTTARHYAQHKTRISVGLGKLLDVGIGAVPALREK